MLTTIIFSSALVVLALVVLAMHGMTARLESKHHRLAVRVADAEDTRQRMVSRVTRVESAVDALCTSDNGLEREIVRWRDETKDIMARLRGDEGAASWETIRRVANHADALQMNMNGVSTGLRAKIGALEENQRLNLDAIQQLTTSVQMLEARREFLEDGIRQLAARLSKRPQTEDEEARPF